MCCFYGQLALCTLDYELYCLNSVRIRSYSGPHFPAFGLNTERCFVSPRIQFESRKMRTNNSEYGQFLGSAMSGSH